MARLLVTADSPASPEAVFDYLADFTTTREWDPTVTDAVRLDDGPLGRGSRFRVAVGFLGQTVELVYEVTSYERPYFFALRGESPTVVSEDELTFTPVAGGTRVGYDARLSLPWALSFADPLLQIGFGWTGAGSVRGLRERLAELPATPTETVRSA